MSSVVDIIQLDEAVPIMGLIALLFAVAKEMPGYGENPWPRRLGAAAFIMYAGLALYQLHLVTAWNYVCLVLRAILAAGLVMAVASVLTPIIASLYRAIFGGLKDCYYEPEPLRVQPEPVEPPPPVEELPPPPPPLTKEAQMKDAREQFDDAMSASQLIPDTLVRKAAEDAARARLHNRIVDIMR